MGVVLEEETRTGTVAGDAPVEAAVRCRYDGATLSAPVLVGRCELSSLRYSTLDAPVLAAGAQVLGCDLTQVRWSGGRAEQAELIACALPHARISDVDLGSLQLCDLVGAHLERVHLARAVGCDFTGALLIDCDLAGADLRGSRFRGVTFQGGSLRGARVDGADFGRTRGLDDSARRRLLADGAWLGGGRATAIARRLSPTGDPLTLHRVGRALSLAGWALGLLLIGGGLWTSLRAPPPAETATAPPARDRLPTEEERNRTRIALADLRAALGAAHAAMAANGAEDRSWPTMVEFQDDHYDLDGDGPGEAMTRLFPGGPPANFLTDSEGGVLPYCNEQPDQATISGVDTDWHYCERTGRVFAGAGFSGQATLNW